MTPDNNCNNLYEEDEIDLREIIAVISRYKYIIIGVTVACMLLSFIISMLIKPVYQARAVLSISSLNKTNSTILKEDSDLSKIKDNLDDMIQLPDMSLQGYQEEVTSSDVLQKTIKKLHLSYTYEELNKAIETNPVKDQNLIEIKVKTHNPELSANIANTVAAEVIECISSGNAQKMGNLSKTIQAQILSEETQLESDNNQLRQLQTAPANNNSEALKNQMNVNKLQSEISMRQSAIDMLNSKLVEIKIMQSVYLANNSINEVSAAVPPESPTIPNKMMNVAVAAVLGLVLSTLGAFFADYMKG